MRRRLAVLADLSKPAEERWDAMQGITGSNEACLLAGKLSGGVRGCCCFGIARWDVGVLSSLPPPALLSSCFVSTDCSTAGSATASNPPAAGCSFGLSACSDAARCADL